MLGANTGGGIRILKMYYFLASVNANTRGGVNANTRGGVIPVLKHLKGQHSQQAHTFL